MIIGVLGAKIQLSNKVIHSFMDSIVMVSYVIVMYFVLFLSLNIFTKMYMHVQLSVLLFIMYCTCPYTIIIVTYNAEWYFEIPEVNNSIFVIHVIGLAAFYAWARAKHFGCHSVILSVCQS